MIYVIIRKMGVSVEDLIAIIKFEKDLAINDENVWKLIPEYPYTLTHICVDNDDLAVYKIICDIVTKLRLIEINRGWVSSSYCAIGRHRYPWRFLYVLMCIPEAKELMRHVNIGVTGVWHERYFVNGQHEKEYKKELELIDRLEQSPLVRSIVKGFLFPN